MRALRLKLIGTLILTVLLSALPAALIARALFRLSLDPLLETSIIEGAEAGLESTRDLLEEEKRALTAIAIAGGQLDTLTAAEFAGLDPREQSALVAWSRAAREGGGDTGSVQVLLEPRRLPLGGQDHLIAYVKAAAGSPEWVIAQVPVELTARAGKLSDTVRLVRTLRRQRDAVMRSLVSSFLVAYGIVVGAVLLVGLVLASRLTQPLAALGTGIERVAGGDLSTRVPVAANAEIARLLTSFNQMVERLSKQRIELARLERLAAWRQMARRLAQSAYPGGRVLAAGPPAGTADGRGRCR
jgi:HAMP domain-containing protein